MAGFGRVKKEKARQQKNLRNKKSLLREAIEFHNQGDLHNAEKAYRSAIKSGLKDFNLLFNLGLICQGSQRTEEAISFYKEAITANPGDSNTFLNLGAIYKDLGNLEQALIFTLKSLKLQPGNPTALINLGNIYFKLGNLNQAAKALNKSVELKPDNPITLLNLGCIYKDLGQLDQAIEFTIKALKLKPDYPAAFLNLGAIYMELGKLDQAIEFTIKALKLKPEYPVALLNLGAIYMRLGKLDQALSYIIKSIDLKPDYYDAHINLSSIYIEKRQFEDAISILEQTLKFKKTASVMINLSKAYSELGHKHESMRYAYAATELHANDETCFINLANLCLKYESLEQGIKAVEKAIEINDTSEIAYLTAARLLCEDNLYARARQILEKGCRKIADSHLLDGELVRVKFLEGSLDPDNGNEPWTDDDSYFFEDCKGSSLIISFGSNGRIKNDGDSVPSFDFKSTLKSFCDHDKLYIRDLDRNYYLNGIKYSATSIAELTSLILQYIHNKNYKNVTTIGSSSGGFAALLYGNLINADHMIAFNPQTVLGEKNKTEINDDIFGPPINAMLRGIKNQDKLYQKSLNLRNFIPFKGKAVIHYSSESLSGIDQRYAKYLQHDNCCVIPYKSTTHLLALQLKEQNLLFEIIANTINS